MPLARPRRTLLLVGVAALLFPAAAGVRGADERSGALRLRAGPQPTLWLRATNSRRVADRLVDVSQPPDGSWGGTYLLASGETVELYVSGDYEQDQARSQAWADFLGTLVHGDELSKVTVFMASAREIRRYCGRGALACYSPGEGLIVAPAEDAPSGVTWQGALMHEYGHHVGGNRLNPPWDAVDWGTKRWATQMDVCAGAATGLFFPGNEGLFYERNPGEAFAEAYRVLNERRLGRPETPWTIVEPTLYPSEAALGALEADVVTPWRENTIERRNGSRPGAFRIFTPLDGRLSVHLRGPASYRLTVAVPGGKVLARGSRAVRATVCGTRSLRVRVRGGRGTYSLQVSRP